MYCKGNKNQKMSSYKPIGRKYIFGGEALNCGLFRGGKNRNTTSKVMIKVEKTENSSTVVLVSFLTVE